jgi:hypothetical protein
MSYDYMLANGSSTGGLDGFARAIHERENQIHE